MGFSRLSSEHYMRWYSGADDGLDDDALLFALELMRHDRRERVVFYDRDEPFEPAEWLAWCKGEKRIFTMVFRNDGTPIATVWFSDGTLTGRQVFSHFCGFSTAKLDELVKAGKLLLGKIVENTRIRQFIGITPACYRHALNLAYALGYEKLACLKSAIRVHGKERDAVLTVCDLSALEENRRMRSDCAPSVSSDDPRMGRDEPSAAAYVAGGFFLASALMGEDILGGD